MKYYIDTEFLEGTQRKRTFGMNVNTVPTIDLISIGIVSEDDKEYYAISKDFNLKEAWDRFQVKEETPFEKYHQFTGRKEYWIRKNVLKKIWRDLFFIDECDSLILSRMEGEKLSKELKIGKHDGLFNYNSLKSLINKYGKTNQEIAIEIQEFVYGFAIKGYDTEIQKKITSVLINDFIEDHGEPKFYAYYADYDWVVFCWLFGNMMSLPKGFPKYCRDLKQILDEKVELFGSVCASKPKSFIATLNLVKARNDYPKQEENTAHSAIDDARWNKQLHEFLNEL
jgi:hypothetical protein